MSYESDMLERLAMPTQKTVELTLLRALLKHGGIIKEFGANQEIVEELASAFGLNKLQRSAVLETVYRKENRLKKSYLWHRLLFRSADSLARKNLVSRPTLTVRLTNRREWMLTEAGFDQALILSKIPKTKKEFLLTKSYEVQKVVKKLTEITADTSFEPFDLDKRIIKTTRETAFRARGFRQAVIEAYHYKCAICGLSIKSPDSISWEVQAAHIIPSSSFGSDDLRNGIALCGLHHWAFDVGWFTLRDDYEILVSDKFKALPSHEGKIWDFCCIRPLNGRQKTIFMPDRPEISPHLKSITWHRENVFC